MHKPEMQSSRAGPPSRTNSLCHAPSQPSGLHRSVTANASNDSQDDARRPLPDDDARPVTTPLPTSSDANQPAETTRLLEHVVIDLRDRAHEGSCNQGTFFTRPISPPALLSRLRHDDSRADCEAGTSDSSEAGSERSIPILDSLLTAIWGRGGKNWRKKWASRMRSKKMSTSSALAERHGVRDSTFMYLSYYLPCLVWVREYHWEYLKSDFVAALSMASMYLPIALSLAENLAHVPPISGLYAFVFNPLVYALLGSCPAMVVGPEAAGSLLVGSVIKARVDSGQGSEEDPVLHARICGVVSGIAGATVLLAGIARLGFLDNVLSRPFLRGFISAIGVVIAVDQLIPELGLARLARESDIAHGSSVDKLRFVFHHFDDLHRLTFTIAAISFTFIMILRESKRRLQPFYPSIAFLPDRLIVVVLSAVLARRFDWESKGVALLGPIKAPSGGLFKFRWPLQLAHMGHIREAMPTGFLIATLGFFESSVAAKALSGGDASFAGIQLSPNRELVALGAANLLGGCFMALPAFGGYGRSKVNKSTGGKSPMSSIFLSLLTLVCIMFVLPYFFYLPKPVLSAMISVVAWSLVEECPSDIRFFIRIHAWPELALMLVIVLATIFYSLTFGIAIGVGLSLLQVVRHATRPRMQILGRIPGTHRFEDAERRSWDIEFVEGCLIVKMPEPLTFANTGELKTRLRRLERYGTSQAHPALPRLRGEDSNRNIIFDIHGVTSCDGSGAQVLEEIVRGYQTRGVRVFFSRGPGKGHEFWRVMKRSGIVELVGGEGHFVGDVQDALRLTAGGGIEESEGRAGGE